MWRPEPVHGSKSILCGLQIVAVPALTREFSPEALPERKDSAGAGGPVAEDEKAAKLKAMQERMEQWKKQAAS